jgi:ribosome-binding protein aMBF1 (putative translation factor)
MIEPATAIKRRRPEARPVKDEDLDGIVFGCMVRTYREKRGWSQAALAKRVEASQTVVSRIENAALRPDLFLFAAIAKAFDVTPAQLFELMQVSTKRVREAAEVVQLGALRSDQAEALAMLVTS